MTGPSPWVIRIVGSMSGHTAGSTTLLVQVPGRWYAGVAGGARPVLAQVAAAELRDLSVSAAAGAGHRLHHADWVITADPAQVEAIGLAHDCAECRAGTGRALAVLAADPAAEVAAGVLYWADPEWLARHGDGG